MMKQRWFQPPRLRVDENIEASSRHATWLELFYDLVFVVAIAQLGHQLSKNVSIAGFTGFVALFVPVWWAWIGTTFYANRFDTDDIQRRIFMALQMLAIAALAVNIHHGLDDSSAGFALSYAASRILLVLEYLWAGWNIAEARTLTNRFATGFSLGAFFWTLSIFIPIQYRFWLWGIGLIIDFATPLTVQHLFRQYPLHPEHLPERFGLFTLIVLGEAIVAVVNGVSEMKWNITSTITAVLGFVTAFSLWWLYFENISVSTLERARSLGKARIVQIWLYAHLPLMIGLATTGVGVEHIIEYAGSGKALPTPERWLICGGLALCYLSLAILHQIGAIVFCPVRIIHRLAAMGLLLVLAIAGTQLLPIITISIVAIVSLIQVCLDIDRRKCMV
jgi:low temperature requirement protein LtrA